MHVRDRGPGNYLTCEMCLSAPVRYEHHLTHPEGHDLVVGCICSAYMTLDADHSALAPEVIQQAVEEAEDAEKGIRGLPGKIDRMESGLAKDRPELQRLVDSVSRPEVPLAWAEIVRDDGLPKLLRRAVRQEEKAIGLARRFPAADAVAWDCSMHRSYVQQAMVRAGQAVIEARKRKDADRLRASIDDADWHSTPKGYRAHTSAKDTMQVFRRDGRWAAMYQIGAEKPSWSPEDFASPEEAKQAAQRAIGRALVRVGRLPM
jgi:hypothetical protein